MRAGLREEHLPIRPTDEPVGASSRAGDQELLRAVEPGNRDAAAVADQERLRIEPDRRIPYVISVRKAFGARLGIYHLEILNHHAEGFPVGGELQTPNAVARFQQVTEIATIGVNNTDAGLAVISVADLRVVGEGNSSAIR